MIKTYTITTHLGRYDGHLPFLNNQEMNEFNNINYSGKMLNGKKTSIIDFLNNLDKGEFLIEQLKFDNGDFTEKLLIIHVPKNS